MLELKDVKKCYSDFELNCSLEVPDGCIVGLIGANGAGKTTLFKLILGLIRPEVGEMDLFGKKVARVTSKELEKMGVVLPRQGQMDIWISKVICQF